MTSPRRIGARVCVCGLLSVGVGQGCTGSVETASGDDPGTKDAGAAPDVASVDRASDVADTWSSIEAALPSESNPTGPSDTGPSDAAGSCESASPTIPTGATIDVKPPSTLAAALAGAHAGDRIVLYAGTYPAEQISGRRYPADVFIEAAPGEMVTISGVRFQSCDHIAIRGVRFAGTVLLDGSSNFTFRAVTLDGGASEEAALQIHGQGTAGASHDVLVENSTILAGGRTVFVLGSFAPSDKWNHHLTFVRNDITCGSHNCFQLSGARDMVIDDNKINGTATSGVLTAGATRIAITRNRFRGTSGKSQAATQIATPGAEWDNYAGVENMISSAIVIANNVVDGWAFGVQLDAARDVAIVYNTVADGTGLKMHHRTPHDQMNNVILDGNSNIRVWDDILTSISIDAGEMRPSFESNNLVWKGGGSGPGLITADPAFASGMDYQLSASSPAIDAALVNNETPVVDFDGRGRGDRPDIGARELGATAPSSCVGPPDF
jgi:hypothetical protein